MRIYRFRVLIDDPSEAFRDVEIGSEQNFLEFHRAIKEAFGFSGDEMASFYVSDEEWGKGPDPQEGTTYPRVVMAMGTPPGEHSKDLDLGPVEEDEEGHTSEFDEDDYDEEDPLSGSSNIDDLGDEYL